MLTLHYLWRISDRQINVSSIELEQNYNWLQPGDVLQKHPSFPEIDL